MTREVINNILAIVVSILQKYDYDIEMFNPERDVDAFQFYRSTIKTSINWIVISICNHVSILQKYD